MQNLVVICSFVMITSNAEAQNVSFTGSEEDYSRSGSEDGDYVWSTIVMVVLIMSIIFGAICRIRAREARQARARTQQAQQNRSEIEEVSVQYPQQPPAYPVPAEAERQPEENPYYMSNFNGPEIRPPAFAPQPFAMPSDPPPAYEAVAGKNTGYDNPGFPHTPPDGYNRQEMQPPTYTSPPSYVAQGPRAPPVDELGSPDGLEGGGIDDANSNGSEVTRYPDNI